LKPGNILLGRRGEVYVIDWGIARELGTPDAFAGFILGTRGYMAPEQERGDADLDERVDIYALGCILIDILECRATSAPPPELVKACQRATNSERDERFRTVAELGDIVQRYLDGDRDVEQRRALARSHLASARAAFATVSEDPERRATVMREAGKALALDPTLDGAAELIGRLMLEPPAVKPREVERELIELDMRSAKLMSRVAVAVSSIYLAMLPLYVIRGITDVPYLSAYGGLASFMLAIALVNRCRPRRALIITHVIAMLIMFALLSRMFTPLAISPAIAAVTLVALSFNPLLGGRTWSIIVTLGTIVSVLGMWCAEWVGLLPPSVVHEHGVLRLISPVDGVASFPPTPILPAMYALVCAIAGTVGYLATRQIRAARDKLVLQAWHLRQLV
ncbi:MAG TPA: hypothetical protein VMZ53_11910, partial [Kofleriaceae bacterium]|nr:hypothetical protein [Kofleriaceae bacterium]